MGCALARELGRRFGNICVIEKENSIAFHTSGRNSGVVHSGFNAKPGTLKASLCVEGSREIRQYCLNREISCEQVGTYVVAVEESQVPILYDLKSRGEKNGVPGIEIIAMEKVREREPNTKGVAALFSPTGAIVDSQALTRMLAYDAQQTGTLITLGQKVTWVEERSNRVFLSTEKDRYETQLVINCAGLHADRLAHMMGVGGDYTVVPFRGEYFVVDRSGPPVIRSMVYPVPNPIVPFLGVHLTKTVAGSVLIGPNAVPAFGREAYNRASINFYDLAEVICSKGPWNALIRNRSLMTVAWNELRHSFSRRHFLREASKLVTGLRLCDLKLGSRAGIRSQLISSNGQLVEDLVVEKTHRSIHVLNMVSPGMTSAIPFAKWLSALIEDDLTVKAYDRN